MKPLSKPFFVAGVQHSKAHTLTTITPTSKLVIIHNPLNPYDAFALEVHIDGVMCGHIPQTEQAAWFYHTMRDVKVHLRLDEWDRSKPPYEQLRVQFVCSEAYVTTIIKLTQLSLDDEN